MLRFLTSFTFLYAFTIVVLVVYGFLYYRSFVRNGYQKRRFPWIFLAIGTCCFSFLYFNIHAPLSLKTVSNLDHHFIRHDGFVAGSTIELGKSDTLNHSSRPFNRFLLQKKNGAVTLMAPYTEEPLYISGEKGQRLASTNFKAGGHTLSFACDSLRVKIQVLADTGFRLFINEQSVSNTGKIIQKGTSSWNIFKDDISFINHPAYTHDRLVHSLQHIFLLKETAGEEELKYFLSGRLFRRAGQVKYDEELIESGRLSFSAIVPDQSTIAWGIGFPGNNKNQFRVRYLGADSFALMNRYPVSYPLTEEHRNDWSPHAVNKFLVSSADHLLRVPAVFPEGFLFTAADGDSTIDFSPLLLYYRKGKAGEPVELQTRSLAGGLPAALPANGQLLLPAKTGGFGWLFSVSDTFHWKFGNKLMSPGQWQLLLFGALGLFFIVIFTGAWLQPANQLSWVWQLLSSVTLVLLTTRFFLYWRYKSFPPYEGLDVPSLQQLNSFWNFGIIIAATLALTIVFGFGVGQFLLRVVKKQTAAILNRPLVTREGGTGLWSEEKIGDSLNKLPGVKRAGVKSLFFLSWLLVLITGSLVAALSGFDPAVCRHLAILLLLLYFVFIYLSYKFSPLVTGADKSWWSIHTGSSTDIIINNPVKLLLSISLLGLFVFVDIGFAIVFLNFLLFNEAFLCINYAVAGLSAGSKKNASLFGMMGFIYLLCFGINLVFGPYLFKSVLDLPQLLYTVGYIIFAALIAYAVTRLLHRLPGRQRRWSGAGVALLLFAAAFLFFPKERILDKAAVTKYRIDVLTMPVEQAIETAYGEGKTYEPVIRAAQNQWFINTFIYEKNNPAVNQAGFHLLPHAPQTKGAKYNAQATDLAASRFLIAEHGKWSVLLYVLLLMVPVSLLASFYKLYPDFTNRINTGYPVITTGFSLLNYLLITALLVILAATGRYIFFGQDLPFGSILSKQSVLFPAILIAGAILLFRKIPLEQYPNRKKLVPGMIVFACLALLLFAVKPVFNKNREFSVADAARHMDSFIETRLQPVLDYFDSSRATRRLPVATKDRLFTDSVRRLLAAGLTLDAGGFLAKEIENYTRTGFTRHLDQRKMIYLDLHTGSPRLSVNENFFRVEPPPHLQQFWTGNLYGDSSNYNVSFWEESRGTFVSKRINSYTYEPVNHLSEDFQLCFRKQKEEFLYDELCLVNASAGNYTVYSAGGERVLAKGDTMLLRNPDHLVIRDAEGKNERILMVQPDTWMRNVYVNGSRHYLYPMGSDFNWARNFSESVASEYTAGNRADENAFVSLDRELMDSLSARIKNMLQLDTAYKTGAEYGICIADGNGRLLAMADFIKGLERPDPNDKAGFARLIRGENGFVSQSVLRKQIGNLNLLRMNPGPGSTLKPIVFSAIASQMNLDWDAFAAEGFNQQQEYFGGEKVAAYDFEKNNGRISSVADYIRYSDNYYHSNLLLLGSYSKQSLQAVLSTYFETQQPGSGFHWPWFSYKGRQYWLNGFENWPGYMQGKANFGSDSSFVSVGLFNNYGIYTYRNGKSFDKFISEYDSVLFGNSYRKSGFILPEYALFDQKGTGMNLGRPNEVFLSSFRGHVKGSSQVMIPPVKMLDAYGKLVSQNRNYSLTLNPYAGTVVFSPFTTDNGVAYSHYLSLMRESVFTGMRQALFSGTAARLGTMLKDASPYYYYAKTGTTGDDAVKSKSKLFALVISQKDITDPDFNFRKNRFYTIYFTSQNGPVKQNEEFQAAVIRLIEQSPAFRKYMHGRDQ